MKLVGKEFMDYVSRKSGKPVVGISLHVLVDSDKVEGKACETVWVSVNNSSYDTACNLSLGVDFIAYYNKYGGVESLQTLDTKK